MNGVLNVRKKDKTGEVNIYGEIVPESWRWGEDEESAYHFKDILNKLGDVDEIIVNINSPGGAVFEGIAIYNMLKRHKSKVIVNVDGLAASIASVIAMAGDEVYMPRNSMLMIHNAMTFEFGNAQELRDTADDLDKITQSIKTSYLDKTNKISESTLTALMDAETWLSADEALFYGFVDNVVSEKQLVACASDTQLEKFNKAPKRMFDSVANETEIVRAYSGGELVAEQEIDPVEHEEFERFKAREKRNKKIKNILF